MEERLIELKKRHVKKIVNLVIICSFCAVLLTASTYAWFMGMKTVEVSRFDIDIATTEGLFLSMDGVNWTYDLDPKDAKAYTGNANQWLENEKEGLIPMSSIGDMDKTSSRMKIYQKASLTANQGGYRVMTNRVNNYQNGQTAKDEYNEAPGYVAFDLFIKNLSGNAYYADNNESNEEAIYLNVDSKVVSSESGTKNTGIENSVRVGFAQIGRVIATNTIADEITGITCTTKGSVTGICREATIWEPNDTKHVQNAINWYNTSCKKRTGLDTFDDNTCIELKNNKYYQTYPVSRSIGVEDKVNVYDGLNSYVSDISEYKKYLDDKKLETFDSKESLDHKLINLPYFTDTMKNVVGAARPKFMTLAPNSITKVRVYVWLEGQDVDNYDFAQLGKKIKINFGFTKERMEASDVPSYDGPTTKLESLIYKDAVGKVILDENSITKGVTYDEHTKIFTIPSTVKSFNFTDEGQKKSATYQDDTKTWNVTDNLN